MDDFPNQESRDILNLFSFSFSTIILKVPNQIWTVLYIINSNTNQDSRIPKNETIFYHLTKTTTCKKLRSSHKTASWITVKCYIGKINTKDIKITFFFKLLYTRSKSYYISSNIKIPNLRNKIKKLVLDLLWVAPVEAPRRKERMKKRQHSVKLLAIVTVSE